VKAGRDQWESLPRHGRKVLRFVDWHGKVMGPGAVSLRVRALAKKAGVRLTMKKMRTRFGCRYAARVVQKFMWHANIKTTMDYYANADAAANCSSRN
jgi:integrase